MFISSMHVFMWMNEIAPNQVKVNELNLLITCCSFGDVKWVNTVLWWCITLIARQHIVCVPSVKDQLMDRQNAVGICGNPKGFYDDQHKFPIHLYSLFCIFEACACASLQTVPNPAWQQVCCYSGDEKKVTVLWVSLPNKSTCIISPSSNELQHNSSGTLSRWIEVKSSLAFHKIPRRKLFLSWYFLHTSTEIYSSSSAPPTCLLLACLQFSRSPH